MTSLFLARHDKERFLLERRILLLHLLDDLVRNDARSLDELLDDAQFDQIQKQFANVLNPDDLFQSIKNVYSSERV